VIAKERGGETSRLAPPVCFAYWWCPLARTSPTQKNIAMKNPRDTHDKYNDGLPERVFTEEQFLEQFAMLEEGLAFLKFKCASCPKMPNCSAASQAHAAIGLSRSRTRLRVSD
jgi:hypothetical protein